MLVLFGVLQATRLVLVIMLDVIPRTVLVLIGLVGPGEEEGRREVEKSPTNQKKTQPHPVRKVFSGSLSRIRVWKRLKVPDSREWEHVGAKRSCVYQQIEGAQPAHDRMGVGGAPGCMSFQ